MASLEPLFLNRGHCLFQATALYIKLKLLTHPGKETIVLTRTFNYRGVEKY